MRPGITNDREDLDNNSMHLTVLRPTADDGRYQANNKAVRFRKHLIDNQAFLFNRLSSLAYF